MAELVFRDLRADEIDCRIATINEKGLTLLLYKDARCDMNILDETVGAFNWKREHCRDNANCIVSIWDEDKKQWIGKEDVGTESNTEAIKGLASDSFKRACFNWGIGRELYTAPFIWISKDDCNIMQRKDGKWMSYDKFCVKEISIEDKKIKALSIYNISKQGVVYTFGKVSEKKKKTKKKDGDDLPQEVVEVSTTPSRDELRKYVKEHNVTDAILLRIYTDCGLREESTEEEWQMGLVYAKGLVEGGNA